MFTEDVSRHGARTLSDSNDGDALLALWHVAQSEGALTPLGRGLGPGIQALLDANAKIGYGLLTASGKQEMESTAARLVQRLPGLFAGQPKGDVDVVAASQQRTVDSATDFVQGLVTANPRLASTIGPVRTDDNLLYLHKSAANADYQYVKNDPRVAAAESAARNQPRTHAVAREVLQRSFTSAFVTRLAAGAYSDEFADEIDAADAMYSLGAVTQDMPDEGHWHMSRYITIQEAAWFGYLDDVTSFYENARPSPATTSRTRWPASCPATCSPSSTPSAPAPVT